MPIWNIFNRNQRFVGEVEANDKETAQLYSAELRGCNDVDLDRPKFGLFRKLTKKERDCGRDEEREN